VIVGAGSVVNRSIPDNCVVAGVPARFIGTFDRFERRGLAEFSSDADLRGKSFREQMDSIVDERMAPEIEIPEGARSGVNDRDQTALSPEASPAHKNGAK
jgi:hypothetical protein